ncbi:MAG: CBS domain-containing protein [Chloroflexi bacterium]|nr:CBS domain-containing protein [Chloroflexota bacterium]
MFGEISLSPLADMASFSTEGGDIRQSLLALGLLIIVAKLAEGVFRRLHLNSILAYASAGILLGPVLQVLTGWSIQPTGHIDLLLTLGIFIFFFLIGLDEIDISSFVATLRGHYFLAAIVSVLFSLGVSVLVTSGTVLDIGIDLTFQEALALAGILSMSSLGIVAKVLADEGRLREPVGLQIFTVVVIAELLTLLVIGFSIGEHSREFSVSDLLILIGKIAGFAALAWLLSSRVLPPLVGLLQRVIQVPQLSLGLLLGVLFLMVDAAEFFGLHGTLGALLFGASLSGLSYQVRSEMMPGLRSVAEGFFVPLFFASAGLYFSFTFVTMPWWIMAVLALIPLFGNFAGAFLGAYVSRLRVPYAVASGLMGKGVAEIALLLVLRELGIIDEVVFSFLVLVMFCYILLMPSVISFSAARASRSQASQPAPDDIPRGIFRFVLQDITVGDILDRLRPHPQSSMSVRAFTSNWATPHQHDYVVLDDDSVPGILSIGMFRYLPAEAWSRTELGQLVRPDPPVAWLDEHVEDVLQRMTESNLTAIPVLERKSGKFVGALTSYDVLELVLNRGRA